MIYVCNFFARGQEGVSNQIELLRARTGGLLLAAGIFMEQPHLAYEDLAARRIILPEETYAHALPHVLQSLPRDEAIHYFSEEPEPERAAVFNALPNDLYVTMYRRPTAAYASFLQGLRTLVRVYVELDAHRALLEGFGIPRDHIAVAHPPSLLHGQPEERDFGHVYIFASWNGGDLATLTTRGLVALLDLVAADPSGTCTVLLRDAETAVFAGLIRERGLTHRVRLVRPTSQREVTASFRAADVVLFLMQERVTKDVPNSVIDGFALGKPVVMTDVVDLAAVVAAHDAGWVVTPGAPFDPGTIAASYRTKSRNAAAYATELTPSRYVEAVVSGYRA